MHGLLARGGGCGCLWHLFFLLMRERDCFLEKSRGRRRSEGRRGRGSLQGCPTTRPGRAQRARNARGDRLRKQPSSRSEKKTAKETPQEHSVRPCIPSQLPSSGRPDAGGIKKTRLRMARDLGGATNADWSRSFCRSQTSNRPTEASDRARRRMRSAAVSPAVAGVVGQKGRRCRFGSEARSKDRAANSYAGILCRQTIRNAY